MKYRKTLRLNGFDYTGDHISFVTFRVLNGQEVLSVVKESLELTSEGLQVESKIKWLSTQFPYVTIHAYVIMPNHVHLLLEINASNSLPDQKIKPLSELIGALKTTSSKAIRLSCNPHFQWQRSFYDRIIRDEFAYQNVISYIAENPNRWRENKKGVGK